MAVITEAANWISDRLSKSDALRSAKSNCTQEIENRIDTLYPIAEKYDRSLRTNRPVTDDVLNGSLEHAATDLWNSTEIAIKVESDNESGYLLCRCKMFASILLSMYEALRPSNERKTMTLKCYLVIFKLIIDRNWIQLKKNVQEHMDDALKSLVAAVDPTSNANTAIVKRLQFEYFLTNFQSSAKEGDLETARIFSSKADIKNSYESLDASTILELCRIIYNAATLLKDSADGTCRINAISLLRDVQDYMDLPVTGLNSRSEFSSLRYSSLLLLTSCLIESDPQECRKYLELVQNLYPRKVDPFVLGIRYCRKNVGDNCDSAIEDVLMKMIMSVDIASSFDAIVSTINDFAATSPKKAANALDYIFLNKLNPQNNQQCLEKIAVSRFFLTTQAKKMTILEIIESLEDFSGSFERRFKCQISKTTMSSIITLLWNSGKKLEKNGNYHESIRFFKLALKDVLSQNYEDKAKLQRALQNAYLMTEDYIEAEKVYESMDSRDKTSPLTQLMLLRICIHRRGEHAALECLNNIRNSEQENAVDVLILAATECKRSTQLAVRAMSLLFEAMESRQATREISSNWCFPTMSLLRYTLQMIMKMAEDDRQQIFTHYSTTVKSLLNNGVEFLTRSKVLGSLTCRSEKSPMSQGSISVHEIEWFAATSYNIALQCQKYNMEPHQSDFASLSLRYIEMIPFQQFTASKTAHYMFWKYRASILCIISKKITFASGNDVALRDLQKHSFCLVDEIARTTKDQALLNGCTQEQVELFNECYLDALMSAYEVALHTRDQTKITEVLRLTANSRTAQIEILLIDTATSSAELPSGMLAEIMEAIIERNIGNTNLEDYLLCSWLRKLIDASFNTEKNCLKNLAERLLARLRTTFNENEANVAVFKQEAEMLATLTWNEGVRSIIKGSKNVGADWCQISIDFARFVNEALESHLKSLWKSLASSADMEDREDRIHDYSQDA